MGYRLRTLWAHIISLLFMIWYILTMIIATIITFIIGTIIWAIWNISESFETEEENIIKDNT